MSWENKLQYIDMNGEIMNEWKDESMNMKGNKSKINQHRKITIVIEEPSLCWGLISIRRSTPKLR